MSKYFAKYLPSKGEIKVGDTVLSTDGGIDIIHDERQIQPTDILLKLFICSRDIQVGDVAQNNKGIHLPVQEPPEDDPELVKTMGERGWFKVIGPISPQAVWVKEGDEFEVNEVEEAIILNAEGSYECERYGFEMEERKKRVSSFIELMKQKGTYNGFPIVCYGIKCPCCSTFR